MSDIAVGRRAALKARHRRAILDAAEELIAEQGSPGFSVDQLAQRADVSRRTVFNHFGSIDDVVLTVCAEALDDVVAKFRGAAAATAVGDGSRASMFEEIAQTLRSTDLPVAIVYFWRAFGGPGEPAPRQQQLIQDVFARVAGHLTVEVARRNPGADLLDVELLVTSLLNGVAVIAKHWITEVMPTGEATGPAARRRWDDLLDRLLVSVRTGYLPLDRNRNHG